MAKEREDTQKNYETQAQLAAILESVDAAIIRRKLDGTVTAWNRAAMRMFGYSASEMIGKPISIVIPSEGQQQELEILERIKNEEPVPQYETKRLHRSGRTIPVCVMTVRPIRDSNGDFIDILEVVEDLTERQRIDQIELDQLFLAAIVSSAEDAIIGRDIDGIVTRWNRAAERMFGYTSTEMIGKSITLLIPPERGDEGTQILERIRRRERIDHYETQRLRKDGRLVDVSMTISPIQDRMGHVIGASNIVRDITDRRRWQKAELAESFLGALIDSAEDAIISKNLDGIVTSWNRAAEKMYGYTAKDMVGKPIGLLMPPDHPDEEPEILDRIRRGERIDHYETKRVRKDGRVIDVSLTVSPIKDSLGRVIGASKIAREITEQKRAVLRERKALQEAERSKQQAEEASRAKDEFLATISHELRTPMTAILGWTRILLSGEVNAETQQKAIETIDRNAKSQAQLIEDLLDVSRIVSGKLRVEFRPVDLTAVIAAAVEAVRPSADAKQIRIQTVLSSGAGPVLGDFERLQQIVWNLLSNAIRFTPSKGLVKIELQRVESQVELSVADNGIGINPDFLPYVFDRFSQADSSIKRSYRGLGMGLAIVKSLVDLHGGVVFVTSPGENRGSVFTIKLPITAVRRDVVSQRPQKPSLQAVLQKRHDLVGVKILVVDDEPDTCDLLRFIFNEGGAIVETASSAEEALQVFDKWKPDILVSDIGMPNIDGYELIRIIRSERGSRIPAVALTAMARIEDRIKVLTAGYQMHVSKPVEPVELITIVSGLVGLINRGSIEEYPPRQGT